MLTNNISMIEQSVHNTILRIKGKASDQVIKKPFETVDIPVNLLKNTIKVKHLPIPQKVKALFTDVRVAGYITGGDWDLKYPLSKNIKDNYHYIGFIERFVEGKEWEETIYYQKFAHRINKRGYSRGGVTTWKEYKNIFLNSWDSLYHDIKLNGYKKQIHITGKPENEIQVVVSRQGKILLSDGIHRTSIAKILGLKKVPVIVNIWHREIYKSARKNISNNKLTPKRLVKTVIDK